MRSSATVEEVEVAFLPEVVVVEEVVEEVGNPRRPKSHHRLFSSACPNSPDRG